MVALLLAVAILLFLAVLGVGIASLFARKIPLAILLTSPGIGLGLVIPLELSLNRAGLPVADFGQWLALGLAGTAALCIVLRKPEIPWRELGPIAPFLAVGGLLAGAPLLLYGFHWAGNSNGDMGVYVSSASNLLHHGFFELPPMNQLVGGSDTPRYMWFWEILPPNRYGTDAFLAFVSAVTRIDTYFVYMPCSVAGFVAFVMASGALCANEFMRKRLIIVVALMATCPLMLFTVYQQILPQLLGQACLVGLVALVQFGDTDRRAMIQRAVSLGCIVTGLSYVYPEISPLLLVGAVFTAPFALWRHATYLRNYLKTVTAVAAIASGTLLLLQNVQIFTFIAGMRILIGIVGTVSNARGPGIINYYIVPSGFANLWGLVPFDSYPEPWLSIAIVVGAFVFAASAAGAVWCLRRYARFSDGMLLGLQLQLAYLILQQVSYSSFKTAFVLLPFWAPLAALALLKLGSAAGLKFRLSPNLATASLVAGVVAATSYSTYIYLANTADLLTRSSAEFTELHGASKGDLYGQIDAIARRYQSQMNRPIRIDALFNHSDVLLGIALRGHQLEFEDLDPFANMLGDGLKLKIPDITGWPPGVRKNSQVQARQRNKIFVRRSLTFGRNSGQAYIRPDRGLDATYFRPVEPGDPYSGDDGVYVETGRDLTILNRSWTRQHFVVRAVPWHLVHNWLAFVNSDFGTPPLFSAKASFSAALGPVEPDPYDRQGDFMGTVGRSMLLEVINGPPTVRLRLALTATLNPRPYTDLPVITIVGANRVTVRNLGFGSARILTPPVRPLTRYNRKYIVVYFGHRLVKFTAPRSWLMWLYGRDVDLDPRRFALYGRDISIDGPAFHVPALISKFPHDLMDPGLLYSGMYEDGWLSPIFTVRLRSVSSRDVFHLRLNIPPKGPRQRIRIDIDGLLVGTLDAIPSRYEDFYARSPGRGNHVVTIRAQRVANILTNDTRPSWGRLREVGFEPSS